MSLDSLMQYVQYVSSDPLRWYLAGGILLAIIVLAVLLYRPLARWREQRQIARCIRRLGARTLRNLTLADGTGGEVTLDYIVLTRECLLVVGVKRFSGLIFGGPRLDQWTQVINRVSYKFPNPDEYLKRQINAVRALAPGVEVRGVHLFAHCARFARDKPSNVLSTRECPQLPPRPRLKEIPAGIRQAWENLARAVA